MMQSKVNKTTPRSLTQTICLARKVLCQRFVKSPLTTLIATIQLKSWGAKLGRGFRCTGLMRVHNSGQLTIGNNVKMNSGSANFVGGDRRMSLWIARTGELVIEEGCGLSNTTIVAKCRVVIRRETLVGGGCDIYDNDFHQLDPQQRVDNNGPIGNAPVEIGPRAFVGGHSIILKGVTIGEGAIVAAGSVVTKDIPPYEIWGGRPARKINSLPNPKKGDRL